MVVVFGDGLGVVFCAGLAVVFKLGFGVVFGFPVDFAPGLGVVLETGLAVVFGLLTEPDVAALLGPAAPTLAVVGLAVLGLEELAAGFFVVALLLAVGGLFAPTGLAGDLLTGLGVVFVADLVVGLTVGLVVVLATDLVVGLGVVFEAGLVVGLRVGLEVVLTAVLGVVLTAGLSVVFLAPADC